MVIDPLMRKALAEVVGTFSFFFIGIGAAVAGGDLLVVAAAHGVMLAIMISVLGGISGGHFNPAVSFGLFIGKHIDARTLGYYWVAQLVGAILAAVAIKIVFPSSIADAAHLGAPDLSPNISFIAGVILELILTFFLVMSVYGTAVDPRHPQIAGFGIGLTVFVDILAGGPLSGGVMNPARALGPELVSGYFGGSHFLVYWIGPLLGGALAGLLYMNVFWENAPASGK